MLVLIYPAMPMGRPLTSYGQPMGSQRASDEILMGCWEEGVPLNIDIDFPNHVSPTPTVEEIAAFFSTEGAAAQHRQEDFEIFRSK